MRRRLPPLSALRAFEAAARLNSVTRAAEELGRTHGAVSRQIRSLQEEAGLPLFDKAGTGIRLNAQGEALRRVVAGALDALEQGWDNLRDEARGPAVHVACSATFAMRWLVPRLAGFYRAHPAIRVRLSMTSARELRHEGADLVIAWDRASYPPADRARAIRLGEVAFGPVCAPGYPASAEAEALCTPVRIAHEHTGRAWDLWQARTGLALAWQTELRFPHTHLCLEAARSGLGVALVERRMAREELLQGRLVAPCGFAAFEEGLAAIPLSGRAGSVAAAAFLAWMQGALAEEA
ncbi:LysR substrate-binding domain-containing protein [Roseomonas sp. E05]|uniref:LysR substrate-binding domain-containing protein n=1 Tax=Roseomonas sp. E05 TaxID=3046310 RepID=UPI0024BBBB5F|nr:LysR substrate-binding domain-containing protein [Roseomonas sp. E05]MDJ0388493.1 LysR substrate-binding domain-containing protein [Roseomonas sp. E05]